MPSDFDAEQMEAFGAPSWQPKRSEALVEAAILSDPDERYDGALSELVGGARNPRAFHKLIKSGVFEYVERDFKVRHPKAGSTPSLVRFTDEGLAYVTVAIDRRLSSLLSVHQKLISGNASIEPV